MLFQILFISLGLLFSPISALAQKSKSVVSKEQVLEFLEDFDSISHYLVAQNPESSLQVWLKCDPDLNWLEKLPTAIHELNHSYDFNLGGFDTSAYFIDTKTIIRAYEVEVFPSSAIIPMIPSSFRKESSRYKIYIKPNVGAAYQMSSITDGIYGLMDEYLAYYQGARLEVLLKTSGKLKYSEYVITDLLESYYEFSYFVALYLKQAQLKHPEVYSTLMDNAPLRACFEIVYTRYSDLIAEVQKDEDLAFHYSDDFKKYLSQDLVDQLESFRPEQ